MPAAVVADRFATLRDGRVLDLATGEDVVLTISPAGGPTDQLRWVARCHWFHRLIHPSLARLLDYGPIGESRRFEAWRGRGPAYAPASREEHEVASAATMFLRACAVTASGVPAVRVIHAGTGLDGAVHQVLLPNETDGYPCDPGAGLTGGFPLDHCGIVVIERRAVAAVSEIFEPGAAHQQPQIACVWGPEGSGKTTALLDLARAARQNGLVPMNVGFLGSPLARVLDGRAVCVIDDEGSAWRRGLLELSLRSPQGHVVVFTAREDPRGVGGAALGPLSAAALAAAIRPAPPALDVEEADRVRRAAERADGVPGRFVRLLQGSRYQAAAHRISVALQVAERAPAYGAVERGLPATGGAATWPDAEELTRLRQRARSAEALLEAGRHARGDRELRQAISGLARRGDWVNATAGAVALASSLLRRGRPREARTILDAAEPYCHQMQDAAASVTLAVMAGVAWTDLGRFADAERVLCAADAAREGRDAGAAVIALALARCRFWRGRFAEADETLDVLTEERLGPATRIRLHAMRARVAVGRLDYSRAISSATEAVRCAEALADPALIAEASCAAAFAHLAVGDTLRCDVEACVVAAAAARDPLRAFRARLLMVEQLRRTARRGEAMEVLRGLKRVARTRLPPILRSRYDLIAEMLTSAEHPAVVCARHTSASGMPALTLFAPRAESASMLAGVVDDAVIMLRTCQSAEDEVATLGQVCEHAQRRLEASAVAFFGVECRTCVHLSGSGLKIDAAVADRASVAGVPIAPHRLDDRVESAVPVRYAGQIVGALAARWTVNRSPEGPGAVSVLTMAATAAAPLVRAMLDARARASVPATHGLLGVSAAMNEIRRAADRAASAPFAVLIEGESGSGKELVARAIHRGGARRDRPFRTLNCAALPDDLVESELFGHARGAFTGAVAERVGVFEEAHSGTLLLDEVGELSPRAQAKLLRVIQEGELRRIGENQSRRIDVRIVSATNRNLRDESAAGRFRVDLLYRLDVVRIAVPPLRERRDDIPLLVDHVWREATARVECRATLSPSAVAVLARYDWPGNVRELQNVLAALAVRVGRKGVVAPEALPPQFAALTSSSSCRLDAARRAFDERFVRAALVRTGGSRARAAVELGISRQGLVKLIARLGLREGNRAAGLPGG